MYIIYEIIYVCKVFLQLLFPDVKIHNISFYGKNGIQFMNTHFVSQIVTIFCKWSTRWLSLCNVGSVPDFSQATACTLILSGMTEFLLRALNKIERGRKLSLPSLNFFCLVKWCKNWHNVFLQPSCLNWVNRKSTFLFWSSKCYKPIYLKKDGTSSSRSFMYSKVCGIMD